MEAEISIRVFRETKTIRVFSASIYQKWIHNVQLDRHVESRISAYCMWWKVAHTLCQINGDHIFCRVQNVNGSHYHEGSSQLPGLTYNFWNSQLAGINHNHQGAQLLSLPGSVANVITVPPHFAISGVQNFRSSRFSGFLSMTASLYHSAC